MDHGAGLQNYDGGRKTLGRVLSPRGHTAPIRFGATSPASARRLELSRQLRVALEDQVHQVWPRCEAIPI